jgi:hypothetical protein
MIMSNGRASAEEWHIITHDEKGRSLPVRPVMHLICEACYRARRSAYVTWSSAHYNEKPGFCCWCGKLFPPEGCVGQWLGTGYDAGLLDGCVSRHDTRLLALPTKAPEWEAMQRVLRNLQR